MTEEQLAGISGRVLVEITWSDGRSGKYDLIYQRGVAWASPVGTDHHKTRLWLPVDLKSGDRVKLAETVQA